MVDMKTVNVLVTSPLEGEPLDRIAGLGNEIKVEGVSPLIVAEKKGDLSAKERLDFLLAKAEVVYGWIHHLPRNIISRAPALKWLQVMSAGIDRLAEEILQSQVMVTNVSGIHRTPISEFAIHFMLCFAKQAPLCWQMKKEKKWQRFQPAVLRSQTVGIIGLGNIGKEIARLAKAFGMRVVATRRSARKVGRARYVDVVYPADQLRRLLPESDFVVLALPLTRETKKMIGEAELRAMKPGAYLINIARGEIMDEEALIRALEEKWIAGAGLDVFAAEPLPPESKLWELPNVIFSPHVSGGMPHYVRQATEIFCENLKRYLAGKKFIHVVDKKRGY